ncbi:hypothetical protein [Falsiroseomonas sp. HW251]
MRSRISGGMNHSARFWAPVEQLSGTRDVAVDRLEVEGPALLREG